MLIMYVLAAAYILGVNVYSVVLVISLKNDYILNNDKPMVGDGKLIIAALLGGAIGIYATMFVTRFKLKDMLLMILLPVIAVLNIWLFVFMFRTGIAYIAI